MSVLPRLIRRELPPEAKDAGMPLGQLRLSDLRSCVPAGLVMLLPAWFVKAAPLDISLEHDMHLAMLLPCSCNALVMFLVMLAMIVMCIAMLLPCFLP